MVVTGSRTLQPGTYCGGLTIQNGARVTLLPGTYIFKDGPLQVLGNANLRGLHTALVFSGAGAVLNFAPDTTIDLTAPRDGPMAGVLIAEDRGTPAGQVHRIQSNNAFNLLGTIYLPKGKLLADGDRAIADRSPWTAIVANRIVVLKSADIVINDRYGDTDIPVPVGIGPGASRLVN